MESPKVAPTHYLLVIGAIILIRLLVLVYFQSSSNQLSPERVIEPLGVIQNDYYMFLGPVDNYFSTGVYELYAGSGEVFAGRMPGYAAPYFLLRLAFPKSIALPLLILLQILLSILATYVLGLMAYRWTGSKLVFYGTVFLFAISTYTSLFDLFTLAESFSVSAIILSFFFSEKGLRTSNRPLAVLLGGFFLAWAIFLRPFLGLLIVFIPLMILFHLWKKNQVSFKGAAWRIVIFCMPFVLMESAWVLRNYVNKGQWILLEEGLSASYGDFGIYGKAAMGIRKLINAYGGDAAEFRQGSDAWWFHHASEQEAENFEFPTWLTKNQTEIPQEMERIREAYLLSMNTALNEKERMKFNDTAAEQALQLAHQIRDEHPLHFFLWNNLNRFRRFVFTNGTYLLPLPRFSEMNLIQKMIKLFYAGLHGLVLVLGLAGLLFSGNAIHDGWPRLAVVSLFFSLIIAVVFIGGIIENRYFISMYPWLLIFSLIFGRQLYTKFSR